MRRITKVIQRLAYSEGIPDRYGDEQPGYAEPVDVPVYAVAPKQSVEPDELGRRAVITGKTVYAPIDTECGPHDRWVIDGRTYEVEGEPAVWDDNPHTHVTRHKGVVFDLERAEG